MHACLGLVLIGEVCEHCLELSGNWKFILLVQDVDEDGNDNKGDESEIGLPGNLCWSGGGGFSWDFGFDMMPYSVKRAATFSTFWDLGSVQITLNLLSMYLHLVFSCRNVTSWPTNRLSAS